MKGFWKRLLSVFLAIVFLLINTGVSQVEAATRNAAAKKAFKKYLSTSNIKWRVTGTEAPGKGYLFRYMELGENKVPVLFIAYDSETGDWFPAHAEGYVYVLQYLNGKVKDVALGDWIGAIYPKSGIIATCYQGGGYGEVYSYYYKLNNKGKLKYIADTDILDDEAWGEYSRQLHGEDKYTINSKSVSKAKFERWLSKKTNDENGELYDEIVRDGKMYIKNTKKNRNKYLK